MIRVQLFGAAAELAGQRELVLDLADETPAREVLAKIFEICPALEPLRGSLRLAVDRRFASGQEPVTSASEVALLPPLGGGGPTFSFSREPLDLQEVADRVRRPEAGALVLFVGTVRSETQGRPVRSLHYEAYEAMALEALEEGAARIRKDLPEVRLAGAHRLGEVAVGEASVVLAASAPHRREAFEACRRILEHLKETVPIFKKEVFESGESRWVGLRDPANPEQEKER